MTTIISTKVSTNRNTPRIWLEGVRLARGQFAPEARYNVSHKNGTVTLTLCKDGERKVSQRSRKPIIDLCSMAVGQWFSVGDKVRAIVRHGRIVIRRIAQTLKTLARDRRILSKLTKGEALDVVSMFSGAGIMDRAITDGFHQAGVKTRTMVTAEIDGTYMDANLKANGHLFDNKSMLINGPAQDFDLGNVPPASLMCVGLPCTGFSSAGRAKGKLSSAEAHPEAGALFFTFLQWVHSFQPAVLILENVKNMLTSPSMDVIRSVLANLNYTLFESVQNGCDHGALENRDRAVVIAMSKELAEHGEFDLGDIRPLRTKPATVADALDPISEDDSRWTIHEYLERKAVSDKQAGKGFARQLYDGSEPSIATITRGYSRIRSTDPHIKHPTKPRVTRLLSPVEHSRMKGLPEGWIQSTELADTRAHEVLGQSVIFPVFEAIGVALGQNLKATARRILPMAGEDEQPDLALVA